VIGLATVVHIAAAVRWTWPSGLRPSYSAVQGLFDEPGGDLVELSEAYRVTTVAAPQMVEGTTTSSLWTAIVATFKAAA